MNLKTVTDNIRYLLGNSEKARNSDNYLIYLYIKDILGIPLIYELFEKFPSFESITRARRKIQAEGYFLPTELSVIQARKKEQEKYKQWAKNY